MSCSSARSGILAPNGERGGGGGFGQGGLDLPDGIVPRHGRSEVALRPGLGGLGVEIADAGFHRPLGLRDRLGEPGPLRQFRRREPRDRRGDLRLAGRQHRPDRRDGVILRLQAGLYAAPA